MIRAGRGKADGAAHRSPLACLMISGTEADLGFLLVAGVGFEPT
jgi:hypothetical protein